VTNVKVGTHSGRTDTTASMPRYLILPLDNGCAAVLVVGLVVGAAVVLAFGMASARMFLKSLVLHRRLSTTHSVKK
jgi:hypothetical protein